MPLLASAIQPSTWFTLVLAVGLLFFLLLHFWYDWRHRGAYAAARRNRIFHCVRCSHLYSSTRSESQIECPRCGFKNSKLTF